MAFRIVSSCVGRIRCRGKVRVLIVSLAMYRGFYMQKILYIFLYLSYMERS